MFIDETPTYDMESAPEDVKEYAHLTEEEIRKATEQFIGEIEQIPPAHSAIKKDGIPVYKLARKGKEVKLDPRKVTISIFEITNIVGPVVNFRVVCSTGTYIRSLANDFGKVLGCGAYLSSLRRTKIGEFNVESAQSIEEFDSYIQQLKGS